MNKKSIIVIAVGVLACKLAVACVTHPDGTQHGTNTSCKSKSQINEPANPDQFPTFPHPRYKLAKHNRYDGQDGADGVGYEDGANGGDGGSGSTPGNGGNGGKSEYGRGGDGGNGGDAI